MDIKSLYYFTEVTKDLNITKTAGRLFISQQTLSNHIKRMEDYYGIDLFRRKPKLALTYAGEQVLEYAKDQLQKDKNLTDLLSDIRKDEKGVIQFGASLMRTTATMPAILPQFSEKYPNVEIRITNANSLQLEKLIMNGILDCAAVVDVEKHADIVVSHVMQDNIYLCVSDKLLHQHYGEDAIRLKNVSKNGAYLGNFSKLPFCMLSNRLGDTITKCFEEACFTPKVYTNSAYLQVSTTIGLGGMAACFVPQSSLMAFSSMASRDINLFPLLLNSQALAQQIYIIRHRDRYLSIHTKYFMNLLTLYFADLQKMSTESLIKKLI